MAKKNITKTEMGKPPKVKIEDGELCLVGEREKWLKAGEEATGTNDSDLLTVMLGQVANALPNVSEQWLNAAIAMLHGIKPQDQLEGMLAAQMVAVHNLSLEVAKRAMLPDQTTEGVNFNINRVTKLMRTFTAQVEALQRYRGKGQQIIQVQHVNVSEGGQAVVGNVNHKGGRGNG